MKRLAFTIAASTLLAATSANAAPALLVTDFYSGNAWGPPIVCASPACPFVTAVALPSPGFKLVRSNTAPGAIGNTAAEAYANGVLGALAESFGPGVINASAQYIETLQYVGVNTPAYIVQFVIAPFEVSTNPGGALGDVRQSLAGFNIKVNNVLVGTLVSIANLNVDGTTAGESILGPIASGFTLPAGFTTSATVGPGPDARAEALGPGGTINVNLGAFVTNQVFTLEYNMFATVQGSGFGSSVAFIGDPFAFKPGPGIDFGGLAIPFQVPAPAALPLLGLGLVAIARRARARPRDQRAR